MEQLIPLLVQAIGGAAGGNVVGAILKKADLSAILRSKGSDKRTSEFHCEKLFQESSIAN